jgi:hypothetical protein
MRTRTAAVKGLLQSLDHDGDDWMASRRGDIYLRGKCYLVKRDEVDIIKVGHMERGDNCRSETERSSRNSSSTRN